MASLFGKKEIRPLIQLVGRRLPKGWPKPKGGPKAPSRLAEGSPKGGLYM